MSAVAVVIKPQIDTNCFSTIAEQCLSSNPFRNTKGSPGSLQHFSSVLQNFKGDYADTMTHVGILIGTDERDLQEIVETLGMPHAVRETMKRGAVVVLVVGSLLEYKSAIAKINDVSEPTKTVLKQISYELNLRKLLK